MNIEWKRSSNSQSLWEKHAGPCVFVAEEADTGLWSGCYKPKISAEIQQSGERSQSEKKVE